EHVLGADHGVAPGEADVGAASRAHVDRQVVMLVAEAVAVGYADVKLAPQADRAGVALGRAADDPPLGDLAAEHAPLEAAADDPGAHEQGAATPARHATYLVAEHADEVEGGELTGGEREAEGVDAGLVEAIDGGG